MKRTRKRPYAPWWTARLFPARSSFWRTGDMRTAITWPTWRKRVPASCYRVPPQMTFDDIEPKSTGFAALSLTSLYHALGNRDFLPQPEIRRWPHPSSCEEAGPRPSGDFASFLIFNQQNYSLSAPVEPRQGLKSRATAFPPAAPPHAEPLFTLLFQTEFPPSGFAVYFSPLIPFAPSPFSGRPCTPT